MRTCIKILLRAVLGWSSIFLLLVLGDTLLNIYIICMEDKGSLFIPSLKEDADSSAKLIAAGDSLSHGSLTGANKNAQMNFSVHSQHYETLEHKQFTKDSLSPLGHTDSSRVSLP